MYWSVIVLHTSIFTKQQGQKIRSFFEIQNLTKYQVNVWMSTKKVEKNDKDNFASDTAEVLQCHRHAYLFSLSFNVVNDVSVQCPDVFVSYSCSPEEFFVEIIGYVSQITQNIVKQIGYLQKQTLWMRVIIKLTLYEDIMEKYLSFGKATEQTGAVVVDAEGRNCSKICPRGFSPQAEPQSLVGVWTRNMNKSFKSLHRTEIHSFY